MKAITPPNVAPPPPQHCRQRNVADRADEGQHRDNGADQRIGGYPQPRWRIRQEQRLPHGMWHEHRHEPADQKTDRQILPQHRPFHGEVPRNGDPRLRLGQFLPPALGRSVRAVFDRRPIVADRFSSLFGQLRWIGQPNDEAHHPDQCNAPQPFGEHELPPEQQIQDDAEFDDEVGRGEQKGEAGDQTGALPEQRPHNRRRGVRAGRARRPEQRRKPDLADARTA